MGDTVTRLAATLVLALRFIGQVVVSGVATARLVLAGTTGVNPGLVRFACAPMSERGLALLGALVTLTPGTTVIDIDPRRRELLLHVLDRAGAEAAFASVRRDFERYVAAIFPPEA